MRHSSIVAFLALCLTLMLALGGCSTSEPEFHNVAGSVEGIITYPPEKVALAAKKAVEELKLSEITYAASRVDAEVTARTAQDIEVDIKIDLVGTASSDVSIRVGTFGDEVVSMKIIELIKKNL